MCLVKGLGVLGFFLVFFGGFRGLGVSGFRGLGFRASASSRFPLMVLLGIGLRV